MKTQLKTLLLLAVVLGVVLLYAWHQDEIAFNVELRKPDLSFLNDSLSSENDKSADSLSVAVVQPVDTAHHVILFFGDSMVEGLCRRFIDYADENHYDLQSVVWYSSTTQLWAETDTLQYFIQKFQPTYVVACLGGNELFVKDLDKRKKYVNAIVKKVGDRPFVWVSPPNWKEDTGINDVIIESVGKNRYFDSRHLELKRGKDHVHPTFSAASQWMDSIAVWMNSQQNAHPLRMNYPTKDSPNRNVTALMPIRR